MKLHKLTCTNCGGTLDMKVSQDATSIFCPYCGQKFYLDDEKKEYKVTKNINKRYINDAEIIRAKNELKKDSRDFKQLLIMLGILCIIPIVIFLGQHLNKIIAQKEGKVSAGYYEDLIGKDYKTVEAHFKAAGFVNIELIDLNDSGISFWDNGKVDTISVGGDTNFESTDWFEPNIKVVISYH